MDEGLIPAVALRRGRDALSEGPFRQRLGRTKFAEPSQDRALQFIHRLSRKALVHLQHHFAEPSSDRAMRFHLSLSRGANRLLINLLINAPPLERNELAPPLAWVVTALDEEQEGR
jgi:hypothetical protein